MALELTLMSHPKVREASVIAVPNKRWMERPLAVVVLRNEEEPVGEQEFRELLLKHSPLSPARLLCFCKRDS